MKPVEPKDYTTLKDVPEEIRNAMNYSGSATSPNRTTLHFDCANWSIKDGALIADTVIMDTSERAHGILLKTQVTVHRRFIFGPTWTWIMRDLAKDEVMQAIASQDAQVKKAKSK